MSSEEIVGGEVKVLFLPRLSSFAISHLRCRLASRARKTRRFLDHQGIRRSVEMPSTRGGM